MLRSLPELMIMIKGMITAAASVGYTMGLLMVITYVFAIAIVNLTPKDAEIETDTKEWIAGYLEDDEYAGVESMYFSSVPETMHNLIIFATFCDDLSQFIVPVKKQSTIVMILCWLYIALSSLTVMNMLIGVLCEVISAVACEEKESMMIDKIKEKFQDIVTRLDQQGNQDGKLSWKEFQSIMYNDDALLALESVNVDATSMIEIAEDFFFNDDGTPINLEFEEFMAIVMDLRQSQTATVKDVMSLRKRVNKKFTDLKDKFDQVTDTVKVVATNLEALDKVVQHEIDVMNDPKK
jgi:hypothetical protein